MKNILVTGAAGQIGTELVSSLRSIYGDSHVVASDLRSDLTGELVERGPFEVIDCLNAQQFNDVVKKYKIDTIYHLAALLSAVAEAKPEVAWNVNMGGLQNALNIARDNKAAVFTPSSIGAFGPTTPADNTPQDTIQRPTSIYGVTKVAGELLCDYYHKRFGVDTRGVRYPGIISSVTEPGGGTTDYSVHIFYEAVKKGHYTCYIRKGTLMDMMYMPDCIKAAIDVMEADPARLKHRNAFNVTAMSFDPEELAVAIRKEMPEFTMDYDVDPVRQAIADSWPNNMDDTAAREEWDWCPKYDITSMTKDMIEKLTIKLKG